MAIRPPSTVGVRNTAGLEPVERASADAAGVLTAPRVSNSSSAGRRRLGGGPLSDVRDGTVLPHLPLRGV
jgi:hypothetical protein